MVYTEKMVWSPLLRLYHWIFAISIVVLVVTGLYVHEPWTNFILEDVGRFPMALFREIHFWAGFALMAAFFARCYLLIFGNENERFLSFAPITGPNIRNFFSTLLYYCYIGKKEHREGHNAFAGLFYLLPFSLHLDRYSPVFISFILKISQFRGWGLLFSAPNSKRVSYITF